jgi:transposase
VTAPVSGWLLATVVVKEEPRSLLVELSVMEQRYHAVLEVLVGEVSVTEVAKLYGVSRNSVYAWMARYRDGGMPALADRSHRPRHQPRQLDSEIEALVCELRRAHPRWGPRRLSYELKKGDIVPVPSRSTVYRVLVRNHLVEAKARRKRREDYLRWERDAPMQLWQLDVMEPVALSDGTEAKLVSGIVTTPGSV